MSTSGTNEDSVNNTPGLPTDDAVTPNAPTPTVSVTPTVAHGVAESRSLFDGEILRQALADAVKKFDPRVQVKNPVMFVVLVGSIITLVEAIAHPGIFTWSITIWLFLTVLFANFAEAMAEGRGKAQADTPAQDALGDRSPPPAPRRHRRAGARGRAGQGRPGGVRGR